MPLRSIVLQHQLAPEDADLLESLFNQFYSADEDETDRRVRASCLVQMFVSGERDRKKLISFLISAVPDPHSMSGTSPD